MECPVLPSRVGPGAGSTRRHVSLAFKWTRSSIVPCMAPTMRIAEVAARSGFSTATLRYYEQLDLLPSPPRTAAGHRAYGEPVLASLAFISRAKMLGCSLEEIADLMP